MPADSVAVLRNIRDRIEGCGDLSSAMKKPARLAALDAAIAALSAQGEPYAWELSSPGGTLTEVAFEAKHRDIYIELGWKVEEVLYTAPGGVGDAVTDTQRLDWLLQRVSVGNSAIGGVSMPLGNSTAIPAEQSRAAIDAALAARTGKGEANV